MEMIKSGNRDGSDSKTEVYKSLSLCVGSGKRRVKNLPDIFVRGSCAPRYPKRAIKLHFCNSLMK